MSEIKVRVVEDDEISRMLLGYLMEDVLQTNKIIFKDDGLEAYKYLESILDQPEQFPDLIFLDLNMPQLGGYEFVDLYEEKFAAPFPHTHLVILTSSVRKKDQEIADEHPSVAGFFNKPLEEAQLLGIQEKIHH